MHQDAEEAEGFLLVRLFLFGRLEAFTIARGE